MIKKLNTAEKTPSFRGILITKTKNITNGLKTEIDIYRITAKDRPFLNNLVQIADPARLMPKDAQKPGFERWKEMLFYAAENAFSQEFRSYLAVFQNKPCGIINFKTVNKNTHIESICTWPVKINEKVKFAGKSLLNQALKFHETSGSEKITIDAITNGNPHLPEKYMELGFESVKRGTNTISMEMSKKNAQNLLKKFEEYFTCTPSTCGEDKNLNKTLDLDF